MNIVLYDKIERKEKRIENIQDISLIAVPDFFCLNFVHYNCKRWEIRFIHE